MITYPLNNIEYSAEDAELFHVTRTSGVYANNSFNYSLLGGNDIEIGIGIAWIKNSEFAGKVVAEKKSTVINMGITDAVYPRIDAIVIQFNAETNETTFVVKQGTPATSPIAPEVVRTSNIYELHLYHILRPAGAVSLSAANITDMRLSPEHCGIMADSVTSVDTTAIQQQIDAFIENARSQTSSFIDETRSETQELITNTSTAVGTLVSNTETRLDAIVDETEQKYDVARGDIDGLVSATQTRLDDIVADTDGKINQEVTSQLTEAKESGEFNGPQGPIGPQGPAGTTDFTQLANKPTTETWTFTLEDSSAVTKAVYTDEDGASSSPSKGAICKINDGISVIDTGLTYARGVVEVRKIGSILWLIDSGVYNFTADFEATNNRTVLEFELPKALSDKLHNVNGVYGGTGTIGYFPALAYENVTYTTFNCQSYLKRSAIGEDADTFQLVYTGLNAISGGGLCGFHLKMPLFLIDAEE